MNVADALKMMNEYFDIADPTADDEFRFTESLSYLIEETKEPRYMVEHLSKDPFWGHIEVMGRIIRFLYKLTDFDEERADFYDEFYDVEVAG